MDDLVLVTGGSGFLGSRCIVALLERGHRVRTTVRSLRREGEVRDMVERGGADGGERLEVVEADLLADAGWPAAVAGCAFVLHVASPFPLSVPRDPDELVRPARDGALRVLRAARDAGVRRVVLTSSFAAIGYGHAPRSIPFTEQDWTELDGPVPVDAYPRSKTLAERAAWDFVATEGNGLELATVNPVGIFGPLLALDTSTSIELVRRLVDGAMPGLPRLTFGVVDVRDVADLHLLAMEREAARGERFLAISGDFMSLRDMAFALREGLGEHGRKVPARELPDWLVRLTGRFDAGVRQLVPELGVAKHASSGKARELLGWTPRSREEALVASARTLLDLRAP
ncbi:MAG: aldehyde reductase [Kineosporiaceae bacterium]|nr:aldehyde reductase [Kineosporiaceae bacterium]